MITTMLACKIFTFVIRYICMYVIFELYIIRYLVDVRWFKQWKNYVGCDELDVGAEPLHPGPVDTSALLNGINFSVYIRPYIFLKVVAQTQLTQFCMRKVKK